MNIPAAKAVIAAPIGTPAYMMLTAVALQRSDTDSEDMAIIKGRAPPIPIPVKKRINTNELNPVANAVKSDITPNIATLKINIFFLPILSERRPAIIAPGNIPNVAALKIQPNCPLVRLNSA